MRTSLSTMIMATMIATILVGCDSGYDSESPSDTDTSSSISSGQYDRSIENDYNAANPAFDSARPVNTSDDDANAIPIEKDVFFKPELSGLTDQAEDELAVLAENIKTAVTDDDNIKISVTAFTDTRETDPYQEELSRLRAENVKEFLRQQGVDVSNWEVQTKDYGAVDAQREFDQAGDNRSRLIVAISHDFGRLQGS